VINQLKKHIDDKKITVKISCFCIAEHQEINHNNVCTSNINNYLKINGYVARRMLKMNKIYDKSIEKRLLLANKLKDWDLNNF